MAIATFLILALLAVAGALGVVMNRNALYSALSLVGVFVATAALYLMLNAPFLAVLQVMVYAGAIMVLFVFVIMLLSLRQEDVGEHLGLPTGLRRVVAVAFSGVLLAQLVFLGATMALTGKKGGPEAAADFGSAHAVGLKLYKSYILPFEVASILLLVAIVGAVAITRRHSGGLEGRLETEARQ